MAKSGIITKYFYTKAPTTTSTSSTGSIVATTTDTSKAVFSLSFEWSLLSQDVVEGTSNISWSLKAAEVDISKVTGSVFAFTTPSYLVLGTDDKSPTPPYDNFNDIEVSIASETIYTTTSLIQSLSKGDNKVLCSGTHTLTHGSDGTLNANITAMVRVKNVYDDSGNPAFRYNTDVDFGPGSRASITGTLTPDAIAKHALITEAPTEFNDEQSPTITYIVPKEVTDIQVGIAIGNTSTISIPYRQVTNRTSYTFNFTDSEKQTLWAVLNQGLNTIPVRFYLKSVFNGQSIEEYTSSTLKIINYTPTLDPEVWDDNDDIVTRLTGNSSILVRYVSKAAFNTGAQAHKGATINTQSVKNSGLTLYGATGTFENVTDGTFEFTVVDSFGRTAQAPMVFEKSTGHFVDYVKLTCNASVSDLTADGDVRVTLTGQYFNGSFGKKANTMRMHYDITKDGDEFEHVDKGYIYPTMNDENYSYVFTISGLDYTSVYNLVVRVSDEVSVEPTEAQVILASTPLFDWGRTDFNFNIPVTIQGGSVPTLIESGTYNNWEYRKWSDGVAECWRTLEVTTAVATSTNASWYSSGEKSETNLSFPFTFKARPAVTVQTMPTGQSWCIVFPSNTVGSTTKTGSYQLMSMSTTSSRTHLLSYQVKGRWK